MTEKLYDLDAYTTEFTGKVLSCEKSDAGKFAVVLDKTLFFPEEGGQSPDKGVLGGANVLDVQIKDEVITHFTDAPLNEGEEVSGQIDWTHRFSNMQQHSGEHIFSGLVHSRYGYDNVGFHLSDNIVTMDYNGKLTLEQARELEFEANRAIVANLPIKCYYPSSDELAALDYRSKKELTGAVRIVTIPGIDTCACCAPHVRLTGEIGFFKVQSLQKYKGGVRISALCGFRALAEINAKEDVIAEVSDILSCGYADFTENIKKLKNSVMDLKGKLTETGLKLLLKEAESIPESEEDVFIEAEKLDANVCRKVVNMLTEKHAGYCGVFSKDGEKTTFVVGSRGKDCNELAAKYRAEKGAKCGGTKEMIQGSF